MLLIYLKNIDSQGACDETTIFSVRRIITNRMCQNP